MANRLKGEASFVNDGAELTVLIDTEALLQVEDATGVGLFQMQEAMGKLALVAQLLRFGLERGCGMQLDRGAAAELLMFNPAARGAVTAALERALPKADDGAGEGGEGNVPAAAKRKSGTGTKR